MKKSWWKKTIIEHCENAGTYKPFFDSIINTLATIMETRDEAMKRYKEDGENPIIEYTNKNGSTNLVKNPVLSLILECNDQALKYWQELGLTAKSWKQLTKKEIGEEGSGDSLVDALSKLGI